MHWMALWLVGGCAPQSPSLVEDVFGDTPDSEPGEACEPEASLVSVDVDAGGHVPIAQLGLSNPAPVAVACWLPSDPSERLLWESATLAEEHAVSLAGLRADQTYDCRARPICTTAANVAFEVRTPALPASIPAASVWRSPTATPDPAVPHLLVNHTRMCEGDTTHRLLAYDLDGHLRWFYDGLPPSTPVAIGAQYVGDGRFLWGGGWTRRGAVEIVELDGSVAYKSAFPGSEGLIFHHEGRMLPGGSVLMLTSSVNTDGRQSWEGFTVWVVDPESDSVVWSWDSQRAVDAGVLPVGVDDVYHANAADVVDTPEGRLLVVSLCFTSHVLAVHVPSGEVAWDFGPGGDFTLRDPGGAGLPDTAYPDCQHGIELEGDRLLVYDNGRYFRDHSRVAEYALDVDAGVATRTWTWTEPDWWEGALGDVDTLPSGRVLVTQAHPECWSGVRGDVSESVEVDRESDEVVWRHRFGDPQDTTYRSERFDGCDAFPQAAFCPEVARRLAELFPNAR
ncbi:MAG: aryl-sulfate sulfotransferase [Myxococcales bacterium]|nr:aryl-sulfate sulfotransferase [Myxococcales bacterium]